MTTNDASQIQWRYLLLRFRGSWNGLQYVNGEEEMISFPFGDGMYDYLVETVHHSLLADNNVWGYIIHALDDFNGVGLRRKKLKNDHDIRELFRASPTPVVFVSLRRINNLNNESILLPAASTNYCGATENTPGGFVDLLNVQTSYQQTFLGTGMSSQYQPNFSQNPQYQHHSGSANDLHAPESCDVPNPVVSEPVEDDWGIGSRRNLNLSDDDELGEQVDVDDGDGRMGGEHSERMRGMFDEFVSWWSRRDVPSGGVGSSPNFRPLRTNLVNQELRTSYENFECRESGRWVIPGAPTIQENFQVPGDRLLLYNNETISVGSIFKSKEALKIAVGMYHVDKIGSYCTKYSDNRRLKVICKSELCPFTISASGKESVWRVSKLIEHTCTVDPNRSGPRSLPSKIIAAIFAPRLLEEKSTLIPKAMMSELQQRNSVHVTYNVALRAKHHAIGMIYGNEKESFNRLPSYLHMLKESNPGSVTQLEVDYFDNKFRNAFFALGASISGFRDYGRPVIVVDGTHLKGKYNGILFVAVTLDGNKQIFPLAVGIGHLEDDSTWTWFMEQVKNAYGTPDNLVIVSDAHRSINNAVSIVFPTAYHCLCYYHMQNNIKASGKSVVSMFYKAAYSSRVSDYNDAMKQLKALNLGVYEKLMLKGPEKWARCKCLARRFEFMTSNAAESFNNRAVWARKLPITSIFEVLRSIIEKWFYDRRSEALSREHEVTVAVAAELSQSIKIGSSMNVDRIDTMRFKVKDGTKVQIVDLTAKTCTCREFELMLIPCCHAAAAAGKINHNIYSYVGDYYKMFALRGMWSGVVIPIPEPDCWEVPPEIESVICFPPERQRQAGRPRQSRYSVDTTSTRKTQNCSRCGLSGHNQATCKAYRVAPSQESETTDATENVKRRCPKKCSICLSTEHNRRKCPFNNSNVV